MIYVGFIVGCIGISQSTSQEDRTFQLTPTITSSPTTFLQPNSANLSPFYLVAQDREGVEGQVWKMSIENGNAVKLYELRQNMVEDARQVLPPEEVELLQKFAASLEIPSAPITDTLKRFVPSSFFDDLTLSPTNQYLAGKTFIHYCLELDPCFGIQRLVVFELETDQQQKILLQIPLHTKGNDRQYYNLSPPVWSSDGKYLALIRSVTPSNPGDENIPIVVGIDTGQVQEMASARGIWGSVVWSPDSSTTAWAVSRSFHHNPQANMIRLCKVQTNICQDIELDLWHIEITQWSSDGKQIIFLATSDENDIDVKNIYLLEVENQFVQKVPINLKGLFRDARGSPDGQLIAVEYYQHWGDHIHTFLVVEPNSGKIISQFSRETRGFENLVDNFEWIWGQDSRSIIGVAYTGKSIRELKILSVLDNSVKPITLPNELMGMEIRLKDDNGY